MIKKNILGFFKSNLESIDIMVAIQGKTAIDKTMGGISKSRDKYFHLLWIFGNLMIKKNILAFLKSNLKRWVESQNHTQFPLHLKKTCFKFFLHYVAQTSVVFCSSFVLSLFCYLKRDGSTIGHLFSICSDRCTQSYFWPKARQPPWALYFHIYRE